MCLPKGDSETEALLIGRVGALQNPGFEVEKTNS